MPKCDFNKVALQLYRNHTSAWVFSCTFAASSQDTFYKNTSGGLLLSVSTCQYIIKYWDLKNERKHMKQIDAKVLLQIFS